MEEQAIAGHIERLEAVLADLDRAKLRMPAIHVSAAIDALWKLVNEMPAEQGTRKAA